MSRSIQAQNVFFSSHVARFGQAYFGDGSRFGQQDVSRRSPTKSMASNALSDKLDRLFITGDDMCDGLHLLEVTLGVKQNLEAVLRPALAAARAAEAAFGDAGVAKKASNAVLTAADKAGKAFITLAKLRLSKFYGESYSIEWGAVGWPDNSLSMPSTQQDRLNLIVSLKTHFTNHPAHESADMDATAAIADTNATAISEARTDLGVKVSNAGIAKNARDAAVANLRLRMNGLIAELTILLSGDDPRWHTFGLSRPADEETPEAPTFTTVLPGQPGNLVIDWDDPLRADYFRVWIFIVGTDTQFRAVATVYDSDATLPGLPSGATVKVRVTSKNDAGESPPGPEAQAVVP
jgi:hypothetical protein